MTRQALQNAPSPAPGSVGISISPKTRKKLRDLAEAESAMRQAPRTQIVECCIDGAILYVASTAKTYLGTVMAMLRHAGVEGDFKAPWLDEAPEADEMSDVVIPKEPGESVLGCRFLRALLEESDVIVGLGSPAEIKKLEEMFEPQDFIV